MGQGFLGCKHLPIIVGLAVLGAGSFIKFILSIGSQSLGFMELALVIGTIAVSLLLLKLLRIKQHLAEYEEMQKSGEIIKTAVFVKEEMASQNPEPQAKRTAGKMAT